MHRGSVKIPGDLVYDGAHEIKKRNAFNLKRLNAFFVWREYHD